MWMLVALMLGCGEPEGADTACPEPEHEQAWESPDPDLVFAGHWWVVRADSGRIGEHLTTWCEEVAGGPGAADICAGCLRFSPDGSVEHFRWVAEQGGGEERETLLLGTWDYEGRSAGDEPASRYVVTPSDDPPFPEPWGDEVLFTLGPYSQEYSGAREMQAGSMSARLWHEGAATVCPAE